jgi:hypothetical protein
MLGYIQNGDYTYRLFDAGGETNYGDAESICSDLGGHVIMLQTPAKQTFIWDELIVPLGAE